jgi:hypothetical protein
MSYLNLHITDGTVTGENVDPVAALDSNYDTLDTKFTATTAFLFTDTVNLANADQGQEVNITESVHAVSPFLQPQWVADSGGTWHKTDNKEIWAAWQTLTIAASTPTIISGGRTPQFRTSSWGRIELRGNVKPSAGNFTLNVWKLLFDGVAATTSPIRAIGNRPNSTVSLAATSKYFRVVGSSPAQAAPVGAETNAFLCMTNDATFAFFQIYYMFTDTSTTPANQIFNLDGIIWDKQTGGYAGNTV